MECPFERAGDMVNKCNGFDFQQWQEAPHQGIGARTIWTVQRVYNSLR